jgi:DNA-binding transcriptional LysR family regulator
MSLDFNLLPALDALLEEESVMGAADRMRLSAPAMSRTLGRIRQATGDPILVRTGRTMTATPRALAIREQVHHLVAQVQEVMSPEGEIDFTTLERSFTVRWHDSLTMAIGPRLLAATHSRAPMVRLRFLAEPSSDTDDLRRGHVDLEAGAAEPELPEISRDIVGYDHPVVVMRRDHPLSGRTLTASRYAEARHVTVSRRGRFHDAVDDALLELQLYRQTVAAAPTTVAALQLVRSSDLLTVVAEKVTAPMILDLGLATVPVPFRLPAIPLYLAWHQRYDGDQAHRWLREEARAAMSDVLAEA